MILKLFWAAWGRLRASVAAVVPVGPVRLLSTLDFTERDMDTVDFSVRDLGTLDFTVRDLEEI